VNDGNRAVAVLESIILNVMDAYPRGPYSDLAVAEALADAVRTAYGLQDDA